MEHLKGKTVLVGKDGQTRGLCVAVAGDARMVAVAAGTQNSVPDSVSRCRPNVGSGHCKIDVDKDGKLTITNLKAANTTIVNGAEVVSKRIDSDDVVLLGKDRYRLDIALVLHTARRLVASQTAPEYSIKHLESVWLEYEEAVNVIQRRQQRMMKRRMLPLMTGSASGIVAAICAATSMSGLSLYITIPVAALSFAIYLVTFLAKDTSADDRKRAVDRLIDRYVCPNPDCRHFMGMQPYKVVRQDKKCRYCGCTLTEK